MSNNKEEEKIINIETIELEKSYNKHNLFDLKESANIVNTIDNPLLTEGKIKKGKNKKMNTTQKDEYLIYNNMNSEELFKEFQKAQVDEDGEKAKYILGIMSSSVTNIVEKKTVEEIITETPSDKLTIQIIAEKADIDPKKAEEFTKDMILAEKVPFEKALPVLSSATTIQLFKAIIQKIHDQDSKFEDLQNQLNEVNKNIANAKTTKELAEYSELNKELQKELEKLAKEKRDLYEDKIKKENELKRLQEENSINIEEMEKLQELIEEFEAEKEKKSNETVKLEETLKFISIEKENAEAELNDIIKIIAEKTGKEFKDISINNLPMILKELKETYKTEKSNTPEEIEEELKLLKESSRETIENLEKTIEDLQKQINKVADDNNPQDKQEIINEENVNKKPRNLLVKKLILSFLGLILISFSALGFLYYKGELTLDSLLGVPSTEETKLEVLEDLPLENVQNKTIINEEKQEVFSEPDKSYLGNEKEENLEHDVNINFEDLPQNNNSEMIIEPNDMHSGETKKNNDESAQMKKNNKNTEINKKLSEKENNKHYLESVKSAFEVNDNKQLVYMNKIFNKGDSFKNYKIAYITKKFIMFMDLDNNNKIIKVYL